MLKIWKPTVRLCTEGSDLSIPLHLVHFILAPLYDVYFDSLGVWFLLLPSPAREILDLLDLTLELLDTYIRV
jgi:hypothetical protein